MSEAEVWAGLAVQLMVWLLCMVVFAVLLGNHGVIVGHLVGVGLALFGIPARWLMRE